MIRYKTVMEIDNSNKYSNKTEQLFGIVYM